MPTKLKNIRIRPASAADFDIIESVHRAAFSICEFGYNGEGALARQLHEDGDVLVSLLAEADGIVVGHALFSRMHVEADGQVLTAAALAPIGVAPTLKSKGIGSQLIKAGLAALKPQGVQLCFAVGHSAYYQRFGFSLDAAKPFVSPYAGNYFMAVRLDENLKLPKSGVADFAPAFARF